jgi:hypothetical protein
MLNMHIAMSTLKDAVFQMPNATQWGMEVALPIGMNASIQTDPTGNLLGDSEGGGGRGAGGVDDMKGASLAAFQLGRSVGSIEGDWRAVFVAWMKATAWSSQARRCSGVRRWNSL